MTGSSSCRTNIYLCVSSAVGLLYAVSDISVAPQDSMDPWIRFYWRMGFDDKKLADNVLDHFDREQYGLRYVSFSI